MVRDGYYYGLSLVAVALLLYVFTHGWILAFVPLLLAAFFLWFFRDPERAIPAGEGLVVSPADGKVTRIDRIRTAAGESVHISIFLSVFNVHVNRSPIAGVLHEVRYKKGEYLNAMNPMSAERNEQNLAVVQAKDGYLVSFTQIAGLLARRIVFWPAPGTVLARGQRVGLIKFGSRVDVLLPGNAAVRVRLGQTVKGGASVLAEVPTDANSTAAPALAAELLI